MWRGKARSGTAWSNFKQMEYTLASLNKAIIIGLYSQGKSIPDVANETGHHQSTIRYHLLKAGVLRTRADGVRMSAWKISERLRGKQRPMSEQTKKKLSDAGIARGDKTAKGTRVTSQGYAEFTRGEHKGRMVHRVRAEILIGRPLAPDEVVHHIDGDKLNNSPENLLVMVNSDHNKMHASAAHKNRERCSNGRFA